MSTSNTVVHVQPPAPPGPASFDYTRFGANVSTTMVDTKNLVLNANSVNTCRIRCYGDPANPTDPGVSTPALATQILYAPYFDASNNAQFNPAVLLGNNCTYVTENLFVQKSVTVGNVFNWTPPSYSSILPVSPVLRGTTFGQTYPLVGGQLSGYGVMYVPQPPLTNQGTIINLNGGTLKGTASLFH